MKKENKKILTRTILFFLLMLILINTGFALESKTTQYKNETIKITPTINICENTSKAFKIERLNYSTGNRKLLIEYELLTEQNNKTTSQKISKLINKYSNTKTGNYIVEQNGIKKIKIILVNNNNTNNTINNTTNQTTNNTNNKSEENKTNLEWIINVNCFNKINQTINLTNKTNNSNNTINETTNNTTINNTNNTITINNSNHNLTYNKTEENETIEINQTTNNNNTNQTISTNNNTNISNNETNTSKTNTTKKCPEYFYIKTNKDIFEEGEKVKINFITNKWPEEYEIKYWIELLNGKIVKKEHTTTNNKTKTYTLRYGKYPEQGFKIMAKIKAKNCEEKTTQKIIILTKKPEEPPKSELKIEGTLNNKKLTIKVSASRSNNSKTSIKINFKNKNNKKILPEQSINLKNKFSSIETKLEFTTEEKEETILVEIEGLGIQKKIEIKNNEIETAKLKIEKNNLSNQQKSKSIKANINTRTNKTKTTEERVITTNNETKEEKFENILLKTNKDTNIITGNSIKQEQKIISKTKRKTTFVKYILIFVSILSLIIMVKKIKYKIKNK